MARRQAGSGLFTQLRRAIADDGRSIAQLGRDCGLSHDRLSRFARGERGLGLGAIEQLCEALGLQLAPKKSTRRKT
jgi:hypothetical protein